MTKVARNDRICQAVSTREDEVSNVCGQHAQSAQLTDRTVCPSMKEPYLSAHFISRKNSARLVILVYVLDRIMKKWERIAESYNNALTRYADQPVLILGDFNSCNLSMYLLTMQQYIDYPTRLDWTIYCCYGNISEVYKAVCRLPIGKSDHNKVHLLLKYKAMVKRIKLVIKQIQVWSDTKNNSDCFDNTNWDVFIESSLDGNELTDTNIIYQYLWKLCVKQKLLKYFHIINLGFLNNWNSVWRKGSLLSVQVTMNWHWRKGNRNCLGTVFESRLSFTENTEIIFKKCSQWL